MNKKGFTLLELMLTIGIWTLVLYMSVRIADLTYLDHDLPIKQLQNFEGKLTIKKSQATLFDTKGGVISTLDLSVDTRLSKLPDGDYQVDNSLMVAIDPNNETNTDQKFQAVRLLFQN